MTIRYFLIIASLIVLTGCSTLTPQKRFPTFAQQAMQVKSIDVVIDATVLTDIDGDNTGFNVAKNNITRDKIAQSVQSLLAKKGYKTNVIFASSGLFIDPSKESDSNVVISDDWKETGETFKAPVTATSDTVWTTQEGQSFLLKVSNRGSDENKSKKYNTRRKRAPKVEFDDIPAPVYQLSSDLLAVVRYNAFEVSTGKSIGTGIATGILTGLLTGGMYMGVSMPVSSANTEITLFDLNKLEVVWHNSSQLKAAEVEYDNVDPALSAVLKPLPSNVSSNAPTSVASQVNTTHH